ncbi:outer membrane beta-barrel protein [Chitinophaga horti]|uniref:Outer membrane beta-barrel protein n=1 Tax=Chitinophaga horti TaxID=2920382 RepID=A0ABY6J038_9BACT|nr:outer membrane beta-barrel family protein [Chitinophaga horti]UYQ92791.1 outer membrane beta-barrel protein [Chitinophaga horti]
MKHSIFTLLFALLTVTAMAQKGRVKGVISDKTTKELLPGATIAVLHAKDSSIEASSFADKNGAFDIQGIDPGKYQVFITYIGYQGFYKAVTIGDSTKVIDLGGITLSQKGVALGGVEIVEQVPPIKVKQDTLEFNAGSFKVRENALTEDLLKKLPGVVVDKDGAIKANGETVTKVYVDGKPFFGNDPKMATRNLPADIVDKVQLIDKKSDQAEFTGINDGEIEKIINITIKQDKRKGIFGRGTAGIGTDDRYGATGSFMNFKDIRKIAFVGGANNVNNMGFSFQDQFGFGGGGGGRGGGGGGMGGGNGSGITSSWMGGVNFSDEYGKRKQVRMTLSYNIADMKRESGTWTRRLTPLNDGGTQQSNDTVTGLTKNLNHRLNGRIEWDIDSFHSVIINPQFSYSTQNNESNSASFIKFTDDGSPVTRSQRFNTNEGNRPDVSGDIQFRKKFRKKGRTVSATLGYGYNSNNQDRFTDGFAEYFQRSEIDSINQLAITDNSAKSVNVRVDYTEPIFKDRFLELNYSYRSNNSDNDRLTYQYNPITDRYDLLDEGQTNLFRNEFANQQASVAIRTQKLKYDYSIGGRIQINDQVNNNISRGNITRQNSVNFAPEARFNYNFSRSKRLRLNYRGQTNQPSMNQLAPVPDSTDLLYVLNGNPDLAPSFTHSMQGSFQSFDPAKMSGFFINLNASYTQNQIVYSAVLDRNSGKTSAQYVNVGSGNYNVGANVSNTIPLFNKVTSLNTNTSLNYGRSVSYINQGLANTQNLAAGERVSLSYFFKEVFDVSAATFINYTAARISGDSVKSRDKAQNNTNFYDFGGSLDVNVNLPLGFRIGADVDYTANRGRGEEFDLDFTMLNGFVSKSLFKNKKGEIKAQVFDLLRQNIAINRTVNNGIITDSRSLVLQRYYMMTFTYIFGKFGGGRGRGRGPEGMPGGEFRRGGFPGGPGGGFPGGGGFRRGG